MSEYERGYVVGYIAGLKAAKVWITEVGSAITLEPQIPDMVGKSILKLGRALDKRVRELEDEQRL